MGEKSESGGERERKRPAGMVPVREGATGVFSRRFTVVRGVYCCLGGGHTGVFTEVYCCRGGGLLLFGGYLSCM